MDAKGGAKGGAAGGSLPKERLARELGYGGEMSLLDAELEAAGLSRRDRPNIATAKRGAVAELIADRFLLVCRRGDCQAEVSGDDRRVVPPSRPELCEMCGGSRVSAALRDMVAACQAGRTLRIVVLGGSPALRTRLAREVGAALELRLVDGTMARTAQQAREDLGWADLVVIWAGTELLHKATMAYPRGSDRIVTTTRRSLPALARRIEDFARAQPARA
jgi:hypothetical protein